MMIVMVFCSAPTSVIICMRRNSSPAGLCMIVSAACPKQCSGLDFRLRLDLAGAFLAQRLGLLRHGALHGFGNFDILHLHAFDLHAQGSVTVSIEICNALEIVSCSFKTSSSVC